MAQRHNPTTTGSGVVVSSTARQRARSSREADEYEKPTWLSCQSIILARLLPSNRGARFEGAKGASFRQPREHIQALAMFNIKRFAASRVAPIHLLSVHSYTFSWACRINEKLFSLVRIFAGSPRFHVSQMQRSTRDLLTVPS